jgi:hypothetical protein
VRPGFSLGDPVSLRGGLKDLKKRSFRYDGGNDDNGILSYRTSPPAVLQTARANNQQPRLKPGLSSQGPSARRKRGRNRSPINRYSMRNTLTWPWASYIAAQNL